MNAATFVTDNWPDAFACVGFSVCLTVAFIVWCRSDRGRR